MFRLLPLLLLVACEGCRVDPKDSGMVATIDLGTVHLGASATRRLPIDDPNSGAETQGEGIEITDIGNGWMDISWLPTREGPSEAWISLNSGSEIRLLLEVEAPIAHWPRPIAVETGIDSLNSLPETGLGDAILPDSNLAMAVDPLSGNAFFGDAVQGRAWRVDPFYNHPSWGIWVASNRDLKDPWDIDPSCFIDGSELYQDGTCTGSETNSDGRPPRGWRYFHGGYAGNGELEGLTRLVSDPDRGRVWALGPGWIQAIDTDLYTTDDEFENSYSYTQLIPESQVELGSAWQEPLAVRVDDRLWMLDQESGRIGYLPLPADGPPTILDVVLSDVGHLATDGDTLFALASDRFHRIELGELETATGLEAYSTIDLPSDLLSGEASDLVAHDGRAWIAWNDAIVSIEFDTVHIHPLPYEGRARALALDALEGGNAEPLEVLYVAGGDEEDGWLAAATPEVGWLGDPIHLADIPIDMLHSPEPHDVYLVFQSGERGCEGELADFCIDGIHPPIVQSFYNPYSLVPPTSAGHPMNLFLSPIIETPRDEHIDSDFTSGRICTPGDGEEPMTGRELGCCSLRWSWQQRLIPNLDYFSALVDLGADTETMDDDPIIAWGINPSVLRQAYLCIETENPDFRETGLGVYALIDSIPDASNSLTTWTHTALSPVNGTLNQEWWLGLAFEEGVDYTLPIDEQAEYLLLHEAMSSILMPGMLSGELSGLDLSSDIGAGNSLDAIDLVDEDSGWPSENPSWVTPIRDGSMVTGAPARNGYYFLSTGTDVEIGANTYRKKELWPVDLRLRAHVMELPEAATAFPSTGSSGLWNLPGMSWEIGTLVNLSEAGAYRETLKYGSTVTEENWEYAFRALRRSIAVSDADRTKSWYQHIFDVTNPAGLFTSNSHVGSPGDPEQDVTAAFLRRLNEELVEPGYARWSFPEEIVEEAEASSD